jgi:hypothetical protein
MKRIAVLVICLCIGLGYAVHAATDLNVAGKVARQKGTVMAIQDAQVRILKEGDDVFIGDILSTGADAGLEVTMIDNGSFTLGARTSFVVIDYTFGQGNNNAVMELLSGAMDGVSGGIAHANPKGMEVVTRTATIGIRGTKFFVGELDGALSVAHWSGGGLLVKNQAGEVFLKDEDVGTTLGATDAPPTPVQSWDGDKKERAKALFVFN